MKTLRSRLVANDVLVGTFCAIPHPSVIEMVQDAGWDFIVIDAEHTQIGRGDIAPLIRAAEVAHTPALLRVPANDRVWIGSALDAGAAGVLVPSVNNASDARGPAIAATRYPPCWVYAARAPGRSVRIRHESQPECRGRQQNMVLAIQLETAEALANVEEIAAIEGIDAIYIGPDDFGDIARRHRPGRAPSRWIAPSRKSPNAVSVTGAPGPESSNMSPDQFIQID